MWGASLIFSGQLSDPPLSNSAGPVLLSLRTSKKERSPVYELRRPRIRRDPPKDNIPATEDLFLLCKSYLNALSLTVSFWSRIASLLVLFHRIEHCTVHSDLENIALEHGVWGPCFMWTNLSIVLGRPLQVSSEIWNVPGCHKHCAACIWSFRMFWDSS